MSEIWTMGEVLVEIMRPKPGVELYQEGEFWGPYPSGAPAIFIDTVARLNHSAGIIGGVGADDFGTCLLERLKNDGVDCSHVLIVPGKSTAVAFVTYFEDGSRKFIFHLDSTPAVMAKTPDINSISDPKYFHIMGCSLMANDEFYKQILVTMKKFLNKGAKVSFDPNIRKELLKGQNIHEIVDPVMKNCSVLFPGIDELLLITGKSSIESAVEYVFTNYKTEVIALKKGSKGCTIYTKEQEFSMGVFSVNPVDPTGAGDSFDATFLCSLLDGHPIDECAKRSSAVAALNTSAFGPMEGKIKLEIIEKMIKGDKINV